MGTSYGSRKVTRHFKLIGIREEDHVPGRVANFVIHITGLEKPLSSRERRKLLEITFKFGRAIRVLRTGDPTWRPKLPKQYFRCGSAPETAAYGAQLVYLTKEAFWFPYRFEAWYEIV